MYIASDLHKKAYTDEFFKFLPKGFIMKGFGKISKVNNLPKTKIVAPHVKLTKNGSKLIKPYARSK